MKHLLLLTGLIIFLSACVSTEETVQTGPAELSRTREDELIAAVNAVNRSTPRRVKAGVTVVGTLNGQDYSADGIAYLTDNPSRAKVVLKDRIFQSPIVHILAGPKKMEMYFPIENSAYSINGNFADPDLRGKADSQLLLAYTFTAKIPVLSSYSVREYRSSQDGKNEILSLENSSLIETITFLEGVPYKVELVNKRYGSKYSIRYFGKYEKEGFTFFRKIRVFSSITGDKATIHYNVVIVNPSISESVFTLTIPEGTTILR